MLKYYTVSKIIFVTLYNVKPGSCKVSFVHETGNISKKQYTNLLLYILNDIFDTKIELRLLMFIYRTS